MSEQNNEREFFPLTDEEGNEFEFELVAKTEYKGNTYWAMIPAEMGDQALETEGLICEYVILREVPMENGEFDLVSIEGEEEDDVADLFDDMFSEQIDYDGE